MFYNKILNLVGSDSYYKGRLFPYRNINYINYYQNKNELSFAHEFKVKSYSSNKYYDIIIENNGEEIKGYSCNCPQFKSNHTCKHVATVLFNYYDEITEQEIIDELAISKSILSLFKKEAKENQKIKEKIDMELIIVKSGINCYLKLKLGTKKKYTISLRSKFTNFYHDLKNGYSHYFGKGLTYDDKTHYFSKEDRDLITYIATLANDYYSEIYIEDFNLIYLLNNFKNIKLSLEINRELYPVNEILEGMPTSFSLNKVKDSYVLDIENIDNYIFLFSNYKIVYYKNNIHILSNDESKYLNTLIKNKINHLTFKKEEITAFSEGLLSKIKTNITISNNIEEIEIPKEVKTALYFDISYNKLTCKPVFIYDNKEVLYNDETTFLRDKEYENSVFEDLKQYGFVENENKLTLDDDQEYYYFLDEILNTLTEKYEIFTSKKISDADFKKDISTSSNFSIGKDGILSYNFKADGVDEDELSSVFAALKAKKKYYKLKNNSILNLENNSELNDLNNLITDLELSSSQIGLGTAEIPKYRALYIDTLKENVYENIKTNNLFDEFIKNFKKYKNTKVEFTKDEEEILRDYQKDGVKWLQTIYKCDLGGILADEMGLGKSLQTIMFIKQILKEKPQSKILIVVPTALIYNWQKEFMKFAPDLKYVVVAESVAKRNAIFQKKERYNIFITSYGLVRNDFSHYENMNFELLAVDEAQNIKNYQANMTKEIKKLKAKCKIALTGTPVENNITEIWSIFDFIMPGYLHNVLKFREKYNIKDVDEDGIKVLKTLNYQISPFILRRKKSDVVKSLPKKIENKVYIDLPDMQKKLYIKVLKDTKKEMDELVQNGGFQKSRMKILQLLTKLRQLCIDPSVLYDNYNGEAIKIEELLKIVKENIANGHKILIFSSFKRILENIKKIFKENNISSYSINGDVKSKERSILVDAFNKDNTNCFLITLKAGGTGLNLTGADVVIHLDIWWNPAVEDQATDRAHRIGQTKTVSVIKLVTKGTIEEKIITLQEKKKVLSNNLIEGNTMKNNLNSLTEQDIKDLLSTIN